MMKNININLKKELIDIDLFNKVISDFIYKDMNEEECNKKLITLFEKFPASKNYMNKVWIPIKDKWMKTYTKNNINLDIYSTQRVESLYSKIKNIKNYIIPVDEFYYNISKLIEEYHNYKSYQDF